MKYTKELKILRQSLPIPIKQGLDLLTQTKGNVEEAQSLFKEFVTQVFLKQTILNDEQAYVILKNSNFDIQKALKIALKKTIFSTKNLSSPEVSPRFRDTVGQVVTVVFKSTEHNS